MNLSFECLLKVSEECVCLDALELGAQHPPLSHVVNYYGATGLSRGAVQTGQVPHLLCEK